MNEVESYSECRTCGKMHGEGSPCDLPRAAAKKQTKSSPPERFRFRIVERDPPSGIQATSGASRWCIIKGRSRLSIGRFLNWLRIPGAIRELEFDDPVTHTVIRVKVGPLFTRITVNGRDYYFSRLTGRFGGTGQGCL